jgi:hypothetical protein
MIVFNRAGCPRPPNIDQTKLQERLDSRVAHDGGAGAVVSASPVAQAPSQEAGTPTIAHRGVEMI